MRESYAMAPYPLPHPTVAQLPTTRDCTPCPEEVER